MTSTEQSSVERGEWSTAPAPVGRRAIAHERWGRFAFFAATVVIVGLGVTGVFGIRSSTATGGGGEFVVAVEHPAVTRPGHAVGFTIEVSHRDGSPITEPVEIAVSADYWAMFDANALVPAPSAETRGGDVLVWEFDPPPAHADRSRLLVSFDARLAPSVNTGRAGFVQIIDDGEPVAEVHFRTRVVP